MWIEKMNGKKILALMLTVLMVTGLLPPMTMPVQAADEVYGVLQSDGTIFETNVNNTIPTEIKITDKKTVTHLYATANVTTIDNSAFSGCSGLTSIDLPAVTTIETDAFKECSGLTEVNLPAVTSIDNYAFQYCSGLTMIDLSEAITSISQGAFYGCSELTTIDLSAVTSIGSRAFNNCSGLATIDLSAVTSIDDYAFYGCSGLTMINIPKVPKIGISVFFGCSGLTTVNLPTVTTIGTRAFNECSGLTEINMPKVESIDPYAFYKCIELNSINLPLVTIIGENAFNWCSGLTTIDLPAVTTIGNSAFYNCHTLAEINLSAVTSIGNYTFKYCSGLTTIDLSAVTSIGDNAFDRCSGLTTINLPKVMTIGNSAFSECSGLTSVDLSAVTIIGSNAFYGCDGLTAVKLPLVTTIEEAAFYGCDGLTTIDLPLVETIGTNAFCGCSKLTTIDLPLVATIGKQSFAECRKLTTVNLPKANTIGVYAFYGCYGLTTVDLPTVTEIGVNAFSECTILANLTVPAVPPSVGTGVFTLCPTSNLTIAGGNTPAALAAYEEADTDSPQGDWYGWTLSYPLTVTNGTINDAIASGDYPTGTTVTITADLPAAGQRFTTWTVEGTGVTFDNAAAETASFTMPANTVEVIANYEAIPVTSISYDANGGAGTLASQQISQGSPQALNENSFTRVGYSFKNWNTSADGTGNPYDNNQEFSATTVTERVILYAQWTENTFTISGRVENGNTTKIAAATVELKKDDTTIGAAVTTAADGSFSISQVPKGDYNLVVSKDGFIVTTPVTVNDADIQLGAIVLYQTLTVSGGTGSGNYDEGATVSITATPEAGQRFTTWTVVTGSVMLENANTATTGFTMPANAVEVFANYEAIPITSISYDANGGAGTMVSQQISQGSPQNLNENIFTWEGYSFKNWNTSTDGTGTSYDNNQEFGATAVTESITLYAQWTENTFAISGRVEDGNSTKIAATMVELKKDDTTIGAAVTTAADGSFSISQVPKGDYNLVVSKDGFIVTTPVTVNDADIQLGAIVLYQTLTVNGGTGSGNYDEGATVSITATPEARQRFTTWTVVTGSVMLENDAAAITRFTMPANAVEVSANYETIPVQTYILTYNENGGTGTMSKQVFAESTKQALAENTFKRTDYGFAGWNTKPDGTGTAYADGADFAATTTTTLYAQWTEGRFTVSGRVVNSSNQPVSGAKAQLMQGNSHIDAAVTTGADGSFTINTVPNGSYNLVVNKNGVVVTTLVSVNNTDSGLSDAIILPAEELNSEVVVKDNTPEIVVGNLKNQFTDDDKAAAADGDFVEIKFIAETKDNTAPHSGDITAEATSNNKTVGLFIDFSVMKTIGSFTEPLGELPSLIEVLIPLDASLQGQTEYVIYRYHDSAVDVITTTPNAEGEKIELIDSGATIKLTAKKFSTYAIAYKEIMPDGVTYRTHIQNKGWETTWASDGESAGTEGQSLRLEAIEINLTGKNLPAGGTH